MRCDANVSVRRKGDKELGTRTETKNVNSFRFVEKAIQYEIERQIHELESGNPITQETRLYDSQQNTTRPMRSKEFAMITDTSLNQISCPSILKRILLMKSYLLCLKCLSKKRKVYF